MSLVLVTGASQGIGAAIAVQFASTLKARLALVSRNVSLLNEVAHRCRSVGGDPRFFPCDLTRERDVEAVCETITKQMGVPDVIVNNAGAFEPSSVRETSGTTFREQVDANLMSAYFVTHGFADALMQRGSGHVFFMASVASIRGYPSGAAYCAAKHGLLGLARAFREETKETGVRVTTVIPGATHTASWEGSGLPESRFIPPNDIARSVVDVFRLSERSVVEEILIRPQLGDI